MDYQQTLDYLYSQLPMFTRIGAAAIKKDLTNTLALCEILGNPHKTFKTIHIAGTNGKGSVSHMLASVLQAAGYKTGLYTSPHLKDFRERIRINGEMIPQETVVEFVASNRQHFDAIQPSFFEMTVALCFDYFAKEKVDVAIIETGLGGRLDSTNVITPVMSVITNIGWDHMDMLGDTLPKIAAEKAGIIKPKIPVIIGEYSGETAGVFIRKAKETHSPMLFADGEMRLENFDNTGEKACFDVHMGRTLLYKEVACDLTGIYQQKNIPTALLAINQLQKVGWNIVEPHIRQGLANVKTSTGLMGRWQKLSGSPLAYCDTGHNEDGMRLVLQQISRMKYTRLHFVLGMVKDKDIGKILSLLPKDATYYFCRADIPRGLDAQLLQQQAAQSGLEGKVYLSVKEAYDAALQSANADDMVFVGGSTFTVAEVV